MEILQASKIVVSDGTFDKSPKMYAQLYTVHAALGEKFVPCIYFLLPGKSTPIYEKMLEILTLIMDGFQPDIFIVDFENAMLTALQETFPRSLIKGCFFHLSQNVKKKAYELGLKREYDSDINLRMKIRSLLSLALIPPEDVFELFELVTGQFPNDNRFEKLSDYFERTYIRSRNGNSGMFPLSLWNHYDSVIAGDPRTSNCCEGFHNSVNSVFLTSHPTIWEFLRGIKDDASGHCQSLADFRRGEPQAKRRKQERRDRIIAQGVEAYRQTNHSTTDDVKFQILRDLCNIG